MTTARSRVLAATRERVCHEPRWRPRGNAVEVELERTTGGTAVTLRLDRHVRGFARFAPGMIRRAMRRQLDAVASAVEGRD